MSGDRYVRHRSLFDDASWNRLCTVPVVVAGVGGLGSHVLMHLARLAPLTIEIWDPASLDAPDLNRQILYSQDDLGRPKVEAATRRLLSINSDLDVRSQSQPLTAAAFAAASTLLCSSTTEIMPPFVLFDCLDSFAARAELEQIRQSFQIPVFHGGVEGWYGQASTLLPEGDGYPGLFGPDYAEMPAAGKPILSTTVAIIAALQVTEYLHYWSAGAATPLTGALGIYNGQRLALERLEIL